MAYRVLSSVMFDQRRGIRILDRPRKQMHTPLVFREDSVGKLPIRIIEKPMASMLLIASLRVTFIGLLITWPNSKEQLPVLVSSAMIDLLVCACATSCIAQTTSQGTQTSLSE